MGTKLRTRGMPRRFGSQISATELRVHLHFPELSREGLLVGNFRVRNVQLVAQAVSAPVVKLCNAFRITVLEVVICP